MAEPVDNMTWVERYLEFCRIQKGLSARTLDVYAENLQVLLDQCEAEGVALHKVENPLLRQWVMRLHSQGYAPRSMALFLSAWRGFYKWLGQEGCIDYNPVQDIRPIKVKKSLPKALAIDDAVRLAQYAVTRASNNDRQAERVGTQPRAQWRTLRDAAMVEMIYSCGLRVSELLSLSLRPDADNLGWVELRADAAWVHVRGKGNKPRAVPLGRKAREALERWLEARGALTNADQSEALFINIRGGRLTSQAAWQIVRDLSLGAGLASAVHPHMLRHSCASHVLQSSGDLRGVQELLGHANISTTQVYTRLDFQHLAGVYDKAHPRAKSR